MSDDKKPTAKPETTPATWTTWVALSTTILAVAAAFSTLKGGSYSTQTQLATVNAANRPGHTTRPRASRRSNTRPNSPCSTSWPPTPRPTPAEGQPPTKASSRLRHQGSRPLRTQEKNAIKGEAETLESLAKYCQKRGGNFGLAAMFLQIAIMLSAIATLLKKKSSWVLGLVLGAIGLGYLLYAWPLYETFAGTPPSLADAAK